MSVNNVENGNSVVLNMIDDKNRDVERGKIHTRVGESLNRLQATSMTTTASVSQVRSTNEVVVNLEEGKEEEKPVDVTTLSGSTQTVGNILGGCRNSLPPTRCQTIGRFLRQLMLVMLLITFIAVSLAFLTFYIGHMFLLQLFVVVIVAYFVAGGRLRWFYIAFRTLPRDVKGLLRYIKLLWLIRGHERKNKSVADIFRQHVARHPNKTCIIFEDQEWTFQQIEDFSNKVATTFKNHGYKKGDVVALLMENRPDFVGIWLGLSKIGIITSLININLRKSSLLHSIDIAKCQALIYSSDFVEVIADIASTLNANIALYKYGNETTPESTQHLKAKNLTNILSEVSTVSPIPQDKSCYHDNLLYIYTSGTTGLPKAAVITNSRFIFIASGINIIAKMRSSDILYTPLPLYHTAGGIMSIGQALLHGNTTVIRKKFSASAYFNDCVKYKCTIAQYIGEMCRYILAVPVKSEDKQHNLRMIFGNGLRPQIWHQFIARFNIPQVIEFYGATEGNANIVNIDNTVGAIGFISRIITSIYPISIIKVNAEGEPIRNAKGLCQVCGPNEPGVFIGKIISNNPTRAFLGYVDKKASDRKIVRDVFTKGDSAFISGDILVADELGYLYFKDRTGDTFRWKGENVSTSEVEAIISNFINYKDCIIYGVEVHGAEGRAGMAAICDETNTLNLKQLSSDIKDQLPFYARPQFLRILSKVDLTSTFKLKKRDLQEEGFDPKRIQDKLYYFDPKLGYQVLTKEIFDEIQGGKIKL
ncbi:long-chain fatty acid transport protein 4 isoform X1 [Vespa velutina]|uniref:long-chain fatty acid transport protein 4 isoform X1 n=2 Tax=Vespa velutina TaxID=202808 RepID=UPI001FB48999|nr:long-chain fatty acid transport protein 4 isoform X1 [Vespa velutina]XP_047361367.1 long-chain fatty acid transport protein 4 isoform X1 [Vespa velutina]